MVCGEMGWCHVMMGKNSTREIIFESPFGVSLHAETDQAFSLYEIICVSFGGPVYHWGVGNDVCVDQGASESRPFANRYYLLSFFVGLCLFVAGYLPSFLGQERKR